MTKGEYNKIALSIKNSIVEDLKDDITKLECFIASQRNLELIMQANLLRNLLDYTHKEVKKTKVKL